MKTVDDKVMNEIKRFFQDKEIIEKRIKSKQYLYNKNMIDEKTQREKLYSKIEYRAFDKIRILFLNK